MKKFLFFFISFFVGIGIFTWVVYTVGWQGIKDSFLVFTAWQGTLILFLTFLTILVGVWKWREVIRGMGFEISFDEVWKIYLAGFSIRFFVPTFTVGARFFQGYALREKHHISWSQSMASVIVDLILEFIVVLTVILFGSLFFLLATGFSIIGLIVILSISLTVFFGGLLFFRSSIFKEENTVKAIGRFFNHRMDNRPLKVKEEISRFFKLKKKTVYKVLALNCLRSGVMFFRACFLVFFLAKRIELLPSFSILGFSYLAAEIPIPMALGSHEAIQSFVFRSLSLGEAKALAFAMIIRGADLIVAFLGAILLLRLGMFLAKGVFLKTINDFFKNEKNWHQ